MNPRRVALVAVLTALLGGCASQRRPAPIVTPPPAPRVIVAPAPVEPAWRAVASPADQALIDGLRKEFTQVREPLAQRFATRLKEQGPLVDPDAALPMAQLTPGSYYCRLIRFGGASPFQTFAPDFCYVDVVAEGVSFTKQTGLNRPEGYIYPDTDKRLVFLGTARTAGAKGGKAYGHDPATDQVGIIERVAPFRWRLLLGRAGQGAILDMYELVPVPATVQDAKPATQPD